MDKKRKGRQKISMEKMKNESNLQVTFSKRRSGLFKKASELCTLCGVEAAVIVFSPGQKVYSFGHPSVDVIVNKYINNITNNNNPYLVNQALGVQHNANHLHELNMELTYVQNLLDVENGRAQYLKKLKKDNLHAPNRWNVPNKNELSLQQLECLKAMMENLQNGVTKEQQNIILEAQNRVNIAYQTSHIPPFDAQTNAFFSNLPYVANDGAGPSGTNNVSYDYHPGFF